MCGRFSLYQISDFLNRWNVELEEPLKPRFNISPTQMIPIITNKEPGRVTFARWGLIPHWAKDEKVSYKMFNAKSETIDTLPSFGSAFKTQRCLIPADGFFEWKKSGADKEQMRITMKDGSLFAFAGLYEHWKDSGGKTVVSCTIITMEPNDFMRGIHDRMPVILTHEDEGVWLEDDEPMNLKALLANPIQNERLKSFSVAGFPEGIARFNERRFFDAHESWEKLWQNGGDEKNLMQGLIFAAGAFHHYAKGNNQGAMQFLERSMLLLKEYPQGYFGIDLLALEKGLKRSASAINDGLPFELPHIIFS